MSTNSCHFLKNVNKQLSNLGWTWATCPNLEQVKNGSKAKGSFIKDPCITHLFILDYPLNESLFDQLVWLNHQPYVFTLSPKNDFVIELHEIQLYSRKMFLLATWNYNSQIFELSNQDPNKRRWDLNGASVKLPSCLQSEDARIVEIFRQKFNFSIEWVHTISCYYSAQVKELVLNNMDVGKVEI